jgi:Ran GTPase-activating protein (RanGAP) involved in mRNA processing and transport
MGAYVSAPRLKLISLIGNPLSAEAVEAIENFTQQRSRILLQAQPPKAPLNVESVISPTLQELLIQPTPPATREWLKDPLIAQFERERKDLGNKEFIKRVRKVGLSLLALPTEIQQLLRLEGLLGLALNAPSVKDYDPFHKRTTLNEEATCLLGEVLRNNTVLQGLYLQGVGLHGSINFPLLSSALVSLSALETLELLNNNLSNAGALLISQLLVGNRTLTHLGLANNKIKAQGIDAIGDALIQNTVLKTLVLNSNPISDRGGIKLADVLRKNKALKELELSKTLMNDEGAIALAGSLASHPNLIHLSLFGNHIGHDGLAAFLRGMEDLRDPIEVILDHNPIDPQDLQLFKTDQHAIRAAYALRAPPLKGSLKGQEGYYEEVGSTEREGEVDPTLKEYTLSEAEAEAEIEVPRVSPRRRPSSPNPEPFRSIWDKMWGWTSSSSASPQKDSIMTPALIKDPKVGKYYRLLTTPQSLQRLEQVHCLHAALPAHVRSLLPLDTCMSLALNDHTVRLVDVSNLGLGQEGLNALWNVLSSNDTVSTLKVTGLNIDALQTVQLASHLAMNAALMELDISYNPISDKGLMSLSTALRVQQNLTYLNLTGITKVTDKGINYLTATIPRLNLQCLILDQIPLTIESVFALKNLLEQSPPLRVLSVAQTGLRDSAGTFLAQALKANRGLEVLILDNNSLSDITAKILAQSISAHPSLQGLHLAGTAITRKGAQYFLDKLRTREIRFSKLTFSAGLLTPSMEKELNQLLERNKF